MSDIIFPEDVQIEIAVVTWSNKQKTTLYTGASNPGMKVTTTAWELTSGMATHHHCRVCGGACEKWSVVCLDHEETQQERWANLTAGSIEGSAGVVISADGAEELYENLDCLAEAIFDRGGGIAEARPRLAEWYWPEVDPYVLLEDADAPEGVEPSDRVVQLAAELNEALREDCQWWIETDIRLNDKEMDRVARLVTEMGEASS